MKIGKKQLFAIFILLILLIFSSFPSTAVAQTSVGIDNFQNINTYKNSLFSDVPLDAWYAVNVAAVYELGLMQGTSESRFSAAGMVALAEAITLAARIHSIYYIGTADFATSTPWYQTCLDYSLANGILNNSYVDYCRPATRSEFAEIMAKALPYGELCPINTLESGAIPDVPANATYCNNVYILYRAGIVSGNDESGTFYPNSNISRAEAAALAARMVDASLRVKLNLSGTSAQLADQKTDGSFAAQVITLINAARINAGIPALKIDAKLNEAASIRAIEIQTNFSHTRPDGSKCFTAIDEVGAPHSYAGENIAIGYETPEAVVKAWLNSPGHRANILNSKFSRIGVAAYANTGGIYSGYAWVQEFAD